MEEERNMNERMEEKDEIESIQEERNGEIRIGKEEEI